MGFGSVALEELRQTSEGTALAARWWSGWNRASNMQGILIDKKRRWNGISA